MTETNVIAETGFGGLVNVHTLQCKFRMQKSKECL
jgi:hypothetical protein